MYHHTKKKLTQRKCDYVSHESLEAVKIEIMPVRYNLWKKKQRLDDNPFHAG